MPSQHTKLIELNSRKGVGTYISFAWNMSDSNVYVVIEREDGQVTNQIHDSWYMRPPGVDNGNY